ncbi:hypothetical protein ABW20_dc0106712 [Dactylellina cionopaga]|nr:hypothetical protein ABW20_dc0106712 [Dactylellina cionopaga]
MAAISELEDAFADVPLLQKDIRDHAERVDSRTHNQDLPLIQTSSQNPETYSNAYPATSLT